MDLQQHAGLHVAFLDQALNPDHGDFDQIRGRTLQGGVHGRPLRKAAGRGIPAVHVGNRADAAEQRFRDAGLAHLGDGAVDEFADAGIALEVTADVQFRFFAIDAECCARPKGVWPYTMPKLTALAPRRMSGVIIAGSM